MRITGTTAVFGIIGHPVAHSLSPLMQNEAFAACGYDAVYVPFEVAPDNLEQAVAGLRTLGVAGFNVTIPHKTEIIACLDELDESAKLAGAVNVVHNRNGHLIGHNTDGSGLLASLEDDLGFKPAGGRVVIIGAGGAARGALASLCRAGAARVTLVNRTLDRARDLVKNVAEQFPEIRFDITASAEELAPFLVDCTLLLNTTSIGMHHEHIPWLGLDLLPAYAGVYDMVYAPPLTPLLREARDRGLTWANGLGMLAAQGEDAFTIWTGTTPPHGLMKHILQEARGLSPTT